MKNEKKKIQKYTYLIAGISDRTLAAAQSISKLSVPYQKHSIIITNVTADADVSLLTAFKALKCSFTKKDITDGSLLSAVGSSVIFRYFLLQDEEEKNIRRTLLLTNRFRDKRRVEIYTLTKGFGSELLFDSLDKGTAGSKTSPVKIRRFHPARNLIYRNLYENSLFSFARDDHGEKIITVIIIGMDSFGLEMLKACLWCGQMDGYVLKIHVIDPDPNAEERFYFMAPEVQSRNKFPKPGEDYYEITFHSGIAFGKSSFTDVLNSIRNPSHVLVSLGCDSLNLETAIKVRELYARQTLMEEYLPTHYTSSKQLPFIQTVIEDDNTAALLNTNQLKNYRSQVYDIHAIGNIGSLYAISNICFDDLEEIALQAHLKWGSADSFHNHEYNRWASLATAIHKKYRDAFYPGNTVLKDILEHKRWNAYMRGTEGYSFGLARDDLARQHNSLVKFDDLSKAEKIKDTVMNQ